MTLSLTLPYPPSANRYWRALVFGKSARIVTSREAKAYKREVALLTIGVEKLDGPLRFTAHVYRPRKSGDLSNRIKVTEDALNGIAFDDDSQIVELLWYRHEDKKRPRVEVTIERVGEVE